MVNEAAPQVLLGLPDLLAVRANVENQAKVDAAASLETLVYKDPREREVRSSSQVCLFNGFAGI